ncbi:uncharacterized protein E5676_scaffold436G00900 [Cucumis melo var. makuwa]|uniref:Uncharacterized protein n=1 Tax=Cucumis melo var. makuwa TaxID=1194695 RepID=A0A5D3DQR6_CUCMM|nr:uncharacterized protein E5676_scaffold436G00900 [Cucumis melo var. makuwa]
MWSCFPMTLSRIGKRQFLKAAKAIINVDEGSLSIELVRDRIPFNISKFMKYPMENVSLNYHDSLKSIPMACDSLFGTHFENYTDEFKSFENLLYDEYVSCKNSCREYDHACVNEGNVANVSALTLRTDKVIDSPRLYPLRKEKVKDEKFLGIFMKVEINFPFLSAVQQIPKYTKFLKEHRTKKRRHSDKENIIDKVDSHPTSSSKPLNNVANAPFPFRLNPPRKDKVKDEELLNIFKEVEINLPLLIAVQQIPKYAKFLKEVCTNKRRHSNKENIIVCQNVYELIKKDMPKKSFGSRYVHPSLCDKE